MDVLFFILKNLRHALIRPALQVKILQKPAMAAARDFLDVQAFRPRQVLKVGRWNHRIIDACEEG